MLLHWLIKEKIEAEGEAQRTRMERSHAYDEERAEAMEHQGRRRH